MDTTNKSENYRFTISTTTANFKTAGKSVNDIIDICKKTGSSGIEGDVSYFKDINLKDLEKIKDTFKKENLVIDTFHLPFRNDVYDDIAALYETDRLKAEDNMKKWIEKSVSSWIKNWNNPSYNQKGLLCRS